MRVLCAAVPGDRPPKSLTFTAFQCRRQPDADSRKFSPVPKTGTAKIGFPPVPVGLSANSPRFGSRKVSPVTNFSANTSPEKPHLEGGRRPVIDAPKKLTLSGSGQENPDFAPEKPHLSASTGTTAHFCCAKRGPFPGNPHSKSLWSPVKPHLCRKLHKRWAEWGHEEGPANSHLCLHRQKTVRADTAWVPWLCGPEKSHL